MTHLLTPIRNDLAEIRASVTGLQNDVANIRADLATLQADVSCSRRLAALVSLAVLSLMVFLLTKCRTGIVPQHQVWMSLWRLCPSRMGRIPPVHQ